MAERWRLNMKGVRGTETEVRIFDSGYSGSVTPVKGYAETGVKHRMGAEEADPFRGVSGTSLEIGLSTRVPGQFDDIFESPTGRFSADLYVDGVLRDQFILLPDQNDIPITSVPYQTMVRGVNLSLLRQVRLNDIITDEVLSRLEFIRRICALVLPGMPIVDGSVFYPSGTDVNASALNQQFVRLSRFSRVEKGKVVYDYAYEALERLTPKGHQIRPANGRVWILPLANVQFTAHYFDLSGNPTTSALYNVNQTDWKFEGPRAQLRQFNRPVVDLVESSFDAERLGNILTSGDLQFDDFASEPVNPTNPTGPQTQFPFGWTRVNTGLVASQNPIRSTPFGTENAVWSIPFKTGVQQLDTTAYWESPTTGPINTKEGDQIALNFEIAFRRQRENVSTVMRQTFQIRVGDYYLAGHLGPGFVSNVNAPQWVPVSDGPAYAWVILVNNGVRTGTSTSFESVNFVTPPYPDATTGKALQVRVFRPYENIPSGNADVDMVADHNELQILYMRDGVEIGAVEYTAAGAPGNEYTYLSYFGDTPVSLAQGAIGRDAAFNNITETWSYQGTGTEQPLARLETQYILSQVGNTVRVWKGLAGYISDFSALYAGRRVNYALVDYHNDQTYAELFQIFTPQFNFTVETTFDREGTTVRTPGASQTVINESQQASLDLRYLRRELNLSDLSNKVDARTNLEVLSEQQVLDITNPLANGIQQNTDDIVDLQQNKVDKTTEITAGEGLEGGGPINDGVTLRMGQPSTISVSTNNTRTQGSHTHELDLSGRSISAGGGLTGGGNLGADRQFTLGTPSTLTVTSTNSVSTDSHTHAIDLSGRTLTLQAGGGILIPTQGQNLGTNRTWNISVRTTNPIYITSGQVGLRINEPLYVNGTSLDVRVHGNGVRGVLLPTAQDIYGNKTFKANIGIEGNLTSDNFIEANGLIEGIKYDYASQNLSVASLRANALVVKSFTAEVAQIFRGELAISKSFGIIAEDFEIPSVGTSDTLTVHDVEGFGGFNVFEVDDIVELKAFYYEPSGRLVIGSVYGEIINISSSPGDGIQLYDFETKFAQNIVLEGQIVRAGSEARSYGSPASPRGVILDSVFASTPSRTVYTWTGNPWTPSQHTILNRLGNLDSLGISGVSGDGAYFRDQIYIDLRQGSGTVMSIGKNADGQGNSGIYQNANNYWLPNVGFKSTVTDALNSNVSQLQQRADGFDLFTARTSTVGEIHIPIGPGNTASMIIDASVSATLTPGTIIRAAGVNFTITGTHQLTSGQLTNVTFQTQNLDSLISGDVTAFLNYAGISSRVTTIGSRIALSTNSQGGGLALITLESGATSSVKLQASEVEIAAGQTLSAYAGNVNSSISGLQLQTSTFSLYSRQSPAVGETALAINPGTVTSITLAFSPAGVLLTGSTLLIGGESFVVSDDTTMSSSQYTVPVQSKTIVSTIPDSTNVVLQGANFAQVTGNVNALNSTLVLKVRNDGTFASVAMNASADGVSEIAFKSNIFDVQANGLRFGNNIGGSITGLEISDTIASTSYRVVEVSNRLQFDTSVRNVTSFASVGGTYPQVLDDQLISFEPLDGLDVEPGNVYELDLRFQNTGQSSFVFVNVQIELNEDEFTPGIVVYKQFLEINTTSQINPSIYVPAGYHKLFVGAIVEEFDPLLEEASWTRADWRQVLSSVQLNRRGFRMTKSTDEFLEMSREGFKVTLPIQFKTGTLFEDDRKRLVWLRDNGALVPISEFTGGGGGSVDWSDISNIPATFPPSSHTLGSHSNVSSNSPSTGQVLKWNGSTWAPAADNNTTYSLMSQAEIEAGTATTARTISALRLKDWGDFRLAGYATENFVTSQGYLTSIAHTHTISNIGGTAQFTISPTTDLKFASSGIATLTFTPASRTITYGAPGTDLAMGGSSNSRTITSSTGNDVSIPVATTSNAGFMSTGDKTKLDGITTGADNYGNWLLSASGSTGTATIASGQEVAFSGNSGVNVTRSTRTIQITVDSTVVRTSGTQNINGVKNFLDNISVGSTNLTGVVRFSTQDNNSNDIILNLTAENGGAVGDKTLTLPNATGTIALTSQLPTVGNGTLTLATSGIATGSASFTANQSGATTFTVNVPGTNLAMGGSSNSRTITSSTGNNVTVPIATSSNAGFMSTGDKSKLDGVETGADNYGGFNISASGTGGVSSVSSGETIAFTGGDGINATRSTRTVTLVVDSTVVRTTGNQSIAGIKSFTANTINLGNGTQVPELNFIGENQGGVSSTINLRYNDFASGATVVTLPQSSGTLALMSQIPTVGNGTLTLATNGIATGSATFTANQAGGTTFTVNVPGTNLAMGGSGNSRTITSSTGSNVSVPVVTTSNAGFMSTGDKSKLDGIAADANNYSFLIAATGVSGTGTVNNGNTLTFTGSGATSVGRNVNQIIITSTDTTYSEISVAEATNVSSSAVRLITGRRLNSALTNYTDVFSATGSYQNVTVGTALVAGTATQAVSLATARTINGVAFDGTANITITANTPNALTAGNGLTSAGTFNGGTARTFAVGAGDGINVTTSAVAVDGTVVRTSGNQTVGGTKTFSSTIAGSINGNAATATTLATARTINGVSFNGSANITITAVNPQTLTFGNGISTNGGNYDGSTARTITVNPGDGLTVDSSGVRVDGSVLRGTSRNTISVASSTTEPLLSLNATTNDGANATLLFGSIASNTTNRYFMWFEGSSGTINWRVSTDGVLRDGTIPTDRLSGEVSYANLPITQAQVANWNSAYTFSINSDAFDESGTYNNLQVGGANVLRTARTINGVSFNGSANITITANTPNALTAGNGLTSAGTFNGGTARTFAVGAGDGISVTSTAVAVDATVVRTAGAQNIAGIKSFTANTLNLGDGTQTPVLNFIGENQGGDPSTINLAYNSFATGTTTITLPSSTGTLALTSDLPTVGNGTLTLATSGIATGSQTFSANQSGNATFTVTVPGTNLGISGTGNTRTITSSTGTNVTIPVVTSSNAGLMSTTDKTKLDGVATNADNYSSFSLAASGTGGVINISSGNTVTITGGANVTATRSGSNITIAATNTTYSAGNGIALSGTTFSVAGGDGLSQTSTGLQVDSTVVRTTGMQTIARKTFNDGIIIDNEFGADPITIRSPLMANGPRILELPLSAGILALETDIPNAQTAGSSSFGYLGYNGTTNTAGRFNGGTTNPTGTTRLNYNGRLYLGQLSVHSTTATAGTFYAGSTNPSSTTRVNYNGEFRATRFGAGGNLGITGSFTWVDASTGKEISINVNGGIITSWIET